MLVAEDAPISRQICSAMLIALGADCEEAEDGRTAVGRVLASPPGTFDLVLMDLQMPEMDGFEAARRLRCEPRFQDLPIVAMTADAADEVRAQCLEAGLTDVITKPFDVGRLAELLLRWRAPGRG